MVDVVKTRGFRSRLPVLPGPASSLTVCLSADPASHTTALPVACGRMGLARALSCGSCTLSPRTSLSPVLPTHPPNPSFRPVLLAHRAQHLGNSAVPAPQTRPGSVPGGEASPSPEPQALRDGELGSLGSPALVEGRWRPSRLF